MKKDFEKRLGITRSIVGIMLEPWTTIPTLLEEKRAPYGLVIHLILFFTIFAPIVAQRSKYQYSIIDDGMVYMLYILFIFTSLFFVLYETLFLFITGIKIQVDKMFTAAAYVMVPIILAIWITYIANYIADGTLTMAALASGDPRNGRAFFDLLPVLWSIAFIWMFVVFYFCLQIMGSMLPISAVTNTLTALLPLFGALATSLYLINLALPGSYDKYNRVLHTPGSMISSQVKQIPAP